MKKAIQFGAGNIGRGFIGAVLVQGGYNVVFADVNMEIVDRLARDKGYTVHITDVNKKDIVICGISAVNSGGDEIVQEMLDAELITTAVGLRILQYIAPTIARGISARRASGVEAPLNVIACENGLMASSQLKDLVYGHLSAEDAAWAGTHVGFVNCSVDRIVPPVRTGNPVDVAVEEFYEWNVEEKAFVGEAPRIPGMNLADNLLAYIERKLFTLNTGHAITAYLGALKGLGTIDLSIADSEILAIVREAMQQSGMALVKEFGFDKDKHFAYIEKIIHRFQNPYLKDDVTRVGREPVRKLSPSDRLIKPLITAAGYGLPYDKLVLGVGAALHFNEASDAQSVELQKMIAEEGVRQTVLKVCGLESSSPLVAEIEEAYNITANLV